MLVAVNLQDPRPIYLQIATGIKEQIRQGQLHPGEDLPSVRELSESLGVNLHTVHRAYQKLRDQGIIHLRLGQRAKVAALREQPVNREIIEEELAGKLAELSTEAFHLGLSQEDFRRLVDEILATNRAGGTSR